MAGTKSYPISITKDSHRKCFSLKTCKSKTWASHLSRRSLPCRGREGTIWTILSLPSKTTQMKKTQCLFKT